MERIEVRLLTYLALYVFQGLPLPDLQRISAFLEMVPGRAEALLAKLRKRKLVYVDDTGSGRLYGLTERARQYLVRTQVVNALPGRRAKKEEKPRRARSARRRQPDRTR